MPPKLHTDMMRLESHGSFAAERTPSEWELAFLEDQVQLSLSEMESRVFEDLHFNSTACVSSKQSTDKGCWGIRRRQ
jgi:hypothetical protein